MLFEVQFMAGVFTEEGDLDLEGDRDLLSLDDEPCLFEEELEDLVPLELRHLDLEFDLEPDGVGEGVRCLVRLCLFSVLIVVGDATDATAGVAGVCY
ncbi:hypothetical protein CEXT_273521 [Caerostris extrusa]|uniref:Uncharacterized protein n=1 Tax=Caerostris extrusa TaxID=172846 RepID=A0AAV4WEM3_CAEEX|nr:hypothetical protein CEXT_273521 [Caerostris extrusa]